MTGLTSIIGREEHLEEATEWFLRLREDTLSETEMAEWIEWCESDPENLEAFAEVQSLWRAAGEQSGVHTDVQITAPVARVELGRRHILQRRVPLWGALAAVVVLVAIGGVFLVATTGKGSVESPSGPIPLASRDYVQTPIAANRQAVLPDGSHVEIGGRSAVDVDYTAPRRRLKLREGEAFFRVKHDTTRPFVVEAGRLEITAVGTEFDVRYTKAETAVTVEEGVVLVQEGSGPALRVRAGEQLLFRNGHPVQRSLMDPTAASAWRSGRLEYIGDSLESVLINVNRYSQREIVLADPALRELSFTGTIPLDSIDAWLDGLEQVFPVAVNRAGDGVITIVSAQPHQDRQ